MIDELKQLLTLVEKMPSMVLWTLFGFAVFKIIIYLSTTGSIVFVLKLVVERWFSYATRDPAPKRVSMDDIWVTSNGAYEKFKLTLLKLKKDHLHYLHDSEVLWLQDAIKEKLYRENKESVSLKEAMEKARSQV